MLSQFHYVALAVLIATAVPRETNAQETSTTSGVENLIPEVAFINQKLKTHWLDTKFIPSVQATDGEYCRRLYLDILGRIPTATEFRAYRRDKTPNRKLRLVNLLLDDPAYLDEYASNWSGIWTNLLVGRSNNEETNQMTSRKGLEIYFKEAFLQNRPYDAMVRELIAATGSTEPGSEGFNGATNFLSGKLDDKANQATAMTCRVFLGLQIQCTQCHNHPFNEWKQDRYWQMNSFFRQTVALRRFSDDGNSIRAIELADQDFPGEESSPNPEAGRIFFEQRNGEVKAATPVFVNGSPIDPSGYLDVSRRRRQLANMIATSDELPRALVNRMWAHFLGYGFTKPVDDMGPHNSPSHPELLDHLSQQFSRRNFDVKELIRWIVLSDPYSLSSRTNKTNQSDDPSLGEAPQFSHFYVRQMSLEQLYESLLTATEADQTKKNPEQQERSKRRWLEQFVVAFGTDEGDETTTFNGTIPQTLMMFNGELIQDATSNTAGGFLHRVVNDNKSDGMKKIDQLYQAALTRSPTKAERRWASEILNSGDTESVLQDIWWAILNGNEFILIH